MEKDHVPSHVAALMRAIQIAGGQQQLAAAIGKFFVDHPEISGGRKTVSQQSISHWLRKQTRLDAIWWPAFEHITSNEVTRRELRDDVFPRDRAA